MFGLTSQLLATSNFDSKQLRFRGFVPNWRIARGTFGLKAFFALNDQGIVHVKRRRRHYHVGRKQIHEVSLVGAIEQFFQAHLAHRGAQPLDIGEIAARLDDVGNEHHHVQIGHSNRTARVSANRLQHSIRKFGEFVAQRCRSRPRMQHARRMLAHFLTCEFELFRLALELAAR